MAQASPEGAEPIEAAELEALRRGDPRVVHRALSELLPKVRLWLTHLLGPGADVDDATQDALAAIAAALRRFEGRSSLSTLAHRITLRVAYRYYGARAKATWTPLHLVQPLSDGVSPETGAAEREAIDRIFRCLDKIPPKARTALVLCVVEGFSPSEAAEIEGISAGAMRARLLLGRRHLARLLKSDPVVTSVVEGRRGASS